MSRTYGKVLCSIWADDDFLALSPDARLLFVALVSQPDITAAGVLPLVERRWRKFTGGDLDAVSEALDELGATGFVIVDDDTAEVWLKSFIDHDGRLGNPKNAAAVVTAVGQIRSETIGAACRRRYTDRLPELMPTQPADSPPEPHKPPGRSPNDRRSNADTDAHPIVDRSDREPEPTTGTASQQPRGDRLATDAVDIWLEHRLLTGEPVRNPNRWRPTTRAKALDENRSRLDALADNATDPRTLAMNVFGLSADQAWRADVQRQKRVAS